MDSRLQRVAGGRVAHLRRSDAPRVAQAIVDAEYGRARVLGGVSKNIPYLEFVREKSYSVVVRLDDWRKILPFFRYSANAYKPVIPPEQPPPPIPSPQPNRVMPPPPVNPAGGLQSFLEGFPFDEYSKLQKLLTTATINRLDTIGLGVALDPMPDVYELNPPERRVDATNSPQTTLYNQVVALLEQLFPEDFPTTAL